MARQKTLTAPTTFTKLPPGAKARINDDYALYAGQTCLVAARPSHDAAIVELESGARERIPVKYLTEEREQGALSREQGEELPTATNKDNAFNLPSPSTSSPAPCSLLSAPCSHDFSPVWGDGELIDCCSCGEQRPPTKESIEQFLVTCRIARDDYAAHAQKSRGKKKLEMEDAVRDKNAQIGWLMERLESLTPKAIAVEVVSDELTPDEEKERHRLELRVEQAFYQAGKALAEIRDRRLYRSTHPDDFIGYCRDRFGKTKQAVNYLIAASGVYDNLTTTISCRVLPTSETQVRDIVSLPLEEQVDIWKEAVETCEGKVPPRRVVKDIVQRLKEKPLTPATDFCAVGDVFILTRLEGKEKKYNGCWAIAVQPRDFTVVVDVHDGTLTVKPDNLNKIDSPDTARELPEVLARIKRLRSHPDFLDRGAYNVLQDLGRHTYLTEVEEKLLRVLEEHYGLTE